MKPRESSLSKVRKIYILTLLILLAISLYTFNQLKTFNDPSNRINRSNLVNQSLQKLSLALDEAEINSQGFILSGDSSLLHKRNLAFIKISKEYQLITELTKDNKALMSRIDNLWALINIKKVDLKATLPLDKIAEKKSPARVSVIDGLKRMSRIKQLINEIFEVNLQQQLAPQYANPAFLNPFFLGVCFLGALIILFVSYFRLNKALRDGYQLEKQLKELVMEAPAYIFTLSGPELRFTMANEKFLTVVGNQDIIGKPIREVFPDLADREFFKQLDNVYTTGNRFKGNEVPSLANSGEMGYYNYEFKATYDVKGVINGVVGNAIDVTEQVNARKKSEISEIKYRELIDKLPVAVYTCDTNGHIVLYNESAVQLWGITPKPGVDMWCGAWKIFDLNGVPIPLDECPMAIALTEGSIFNPELIIERPDGTRRIIIPHPRPIYDHNGNITGAINTLVDVTEQINSRKRIEASERAYNQMLMKSPFAFSILKGPDLVVTLVNDSMKKLWGKGNNVEGKALLDFLPEVKDQEFPELLKNVYKTGISHYGYESHIRLKKNGKMQDLYINCVFQPYYEADGTISGSTTLAIDVTYEVMGRKQMEATEKLFQLLADNAPVLIWIADKNKLCTFFNKFWLDFTGRTLEQEQGNGWAEGIHPEDIKRCFDHYSACFDERKEFYMEYRLRRNDGEYRWVSDKGIPNYSPEGEFLGYIGACMDIHDQRTQAKLIKENEEKLKIIIDTSELGIFELNLKTMEPTYSARYLEILGYKDFVQLTHAQILEHLHPDDLPIREEAFKQAFITGTLIYESRVVWKDKSIHWIEGKGKIFYDEENHPVKVMGIVQDITEKKLHQQQLEEREQKFRLLGDSMPQHIWTADIHGNLNYYNQSVFEYTGLTLEDLTRDGWLQIVHPEDREENMLVWMHSIATGEDFLFEHRFRRYDGEYRWQLSRAIPQKDSSGKIKMWVGTSTDIHNQKTFVNELEKQVEDRTRELVLKNMALEKVNQELELFAHISSHDLQEPLRKIQMSTSRILEKDYEILSDKGKQHFKRLQEGAHSIQTLIEDLTSYSRTNSEGDFKELTDLNQVIQEVLHDLKIRIEEKNAIIEVDKLPTLNVFPFQLRQLFHNLIGNALKFSKPNIPPQISITHKIVLGEEVKNAALLPNIKYSCFTVADNGIGFEQKYNQKIFEVFQRLHGKEVYEGSGIGLAIVSKIVENHHGKIIAEGILNIGAKFNIFVPMI